VYEVTPGAVRARDARTGTLVWQRSPGTAPSGFATVVVASSPRQVVIGYGTRLTSLDHDGHLIYRTTTAAGPISRLLPAGPRLYVGIDGQRSGRSCD
jgi:outer membrane protein assembly factor BamB